MTVCHVILVVQDWFSDVSLLRFLLSAEMLKPSTLSGSHGSGSGQDDMHEFFPQLGTHCFLFFSIILSVCK